MRRLVFVVLVSSLLVALASVQKGIVPVVKASSSMHQGDLVLTGNTMYTIEGRFDINGSIIVEENATLILRNAIVNFTQSENYEHNMTLRNPVNGNPRLQSKNTTITSNYYFFVWLLQNSSATISHTTITCYLRSKYSAVASIFNSTIEFLDVYDSAVASVFNSTINRQLAVAHSSVVSVSNSTINTLYIGSKSVNCSVSNIGPGFFSLWNYHLNSSVVIAPDGYAPNVMVRNTTIEEWRLSFLGSWDPGTEVGSNATITNSALGYLASYYHTVAWLVNSTVSGFQMKYGGRAYVSWYLHVHVIDSVGQDVPSANVMAIYPNATVVESKLTDANGWTKLILMEKMMNATGEYPVGNYTVEATYETVEATYTDHTRVNMTGNKQIVLTLEGFVIPEFPSFLILPLFMISTLLAVVIYRRKHSV